jgi:hypothetical protein
MRCLVFVLCADVFVSADLIYPLLLHCAISQLLQLVVSMQREELNDSMLSDASCLLSSRLHSAIVRKRKMRESRRKRRKKKSDTVSSAPALLTTPLSSSCCYLQFSLMYAI